MPARIGFIVPLENENRWSDLLATLISSDPSAAAGVLGLGDVDGREVVVEREVVDARDRVDLLIRVGGDLRTVVEAKVLAGLGSQQLARYSRSYPGAGNYLLLHPARLIVDPSAASGWRPLTWESVIAAFARSADPWVSETANAWLDHLSLALPELGPDVQWNVVPKGQPFALAMRARMSWVYARLRAAPPVRTELLPSGGSKAWVALVLADAARDGYVVGGEVEPTGGRNWPALGNGEPDSAVQPMFWVGVRQHGVADSSSFDWDYLASMWPAMAAARSDWVGTRPHLRHPHDRAKWERIGSPRTLGYGFGWAQALKSGVCMFGARFRLPANAALADVARELQAVADLVGGLATRS